MSCRIGDLRNKEVISTKDGARIGFVCDVELDLSSSRLLSIVVYGKLRLFGLLGRQRDVVIPWEAITLIGGDTVLVDFEEKKERREEGVFGALLQKLNL